MRVEFIDNVPKQGAFALFNYSEVLAQQVGFVDIVGIVRRHEGAWLDELAASHAALFSHMALENKWVWASAASRLDARPWGQEYLIKPLFFAAAVVRWIDANPGVMRLSLVNCPGEVAEYLRDMHPGVNVEGATGTAPVKTVGVILNVLHDVINVMRYHAKRNLSEAPDVRSNLVAFERLYGVTVSEGHCYYFTSLLDDVGADQISFLATGLVPPNMRDADDAQRPRHLVAYDGCSVLDILRGVIVDWRVYALLRKVADSVPECTIGGARTGLFWQRFLRVMASRSSVFGAYLTYCGAARLMAGGGG